MLASIEDPYILTDAGRSAFALIVEALNLRGKRIIFPAYFCDSLLPVIKKYEITPVFVDIEEETFQPSLHHYESALQRYPDIAAVLLCRTYGIALDKEIKKLLTQRNLLIIEDASHCTEFNTLTGLRQSGIDARFASLTKIYAVPDGGIAVFKEKPRNFSLKRFSRPLLSRVKTLLQLNAIFRIWLYGLRTAKKAMSHEAPWFYGIQSCSNKTKRLLQKQAPLKAVPYGLPLLIKENRDDIIRKLASQKIEARPIWDQPIVRSTEVEELFSVNERDFPVTMKIAEQICLLPIQSVITKKQLNSYVKTLKTLLPEYTTQRLDEWNRDILPQLSES